MSQFFASGGPSIGVSASASVLPMNKELNTTERLNGTELALLWEVERKKKKTFKIWETFSKTKAQGYRELQ